MKLTFNADGTVRSGELAKPFDPDAHNREVIERTFRMNRLHVAAMLLGGLVARNGRTLTEAERDGGLEEAEKLMASNESRKVVMP